MQISSQASKEEGSTTTGLPDMQTRASPKALPPNWGEDIVSTAWKHAAVVQAFEGNWTVNSNGCWEWSKGKSHGYGQLRVKEIFGDYPLYAHRISYVLHHGPISNDIVICHKCDNPSCVNPDHLFAGSQGDNMRDMANKKRSTLGEKNGQAKITDKEAQLIRNEKGLKQYEIASKYGISDAQVSRILRGYQRSDKPLNRNHGNAKLSEDDVLNIYRLNDSGCNYADISKTVGLSRATVRDVVLGKTWKRLYARRRTSDSA